MSISKLSDSELVASFSDLVIDERENLVAQLDHIAELDRRKLFFEYSSLWAYLVHEKGMEDWAAERRISAARLLRRIPSIKVKLESGQLNLSLLELAQACASREKLPTEALCDLLDAISGLSVRKARREIAGWYPHSIEVTHDRIRPITADLSEVTFVANQALLDQLEEIRGLLAHSHPKAALAEVIGVIASEYRERHHPQARAQRSKSPPTSGVVRTRSPSQSLKHALTLDSGYRCAYVDPNSGKRCHSTYGLQIDHLKAWVLGGKTELTNLRYLCQGHHARVTFLQFGERARPSIVVARV